ncbi:MAG: DNA ligase (NAD(+)) LigA, partial [Deltaproteobacteria bacterium]|nr:DNA ligase (NAD(+)) LigA [Deltaproteobacteria bacterium]
GATIHHPRYAIAYKFQGDAGVTTLVDVRWSVSRTGTITPIGIVEPVELSGATVTRVSLHNVGLMKKLGVTKGAKVTMMRRGGVIPNLENVVAHGKEPIAVPRRCPACGARAELSDDFLVCTNAKRCVQAKLGELKHFMQVIECEGFGDKLLEQLVAAGLVDDPADFYTLQVKDLLQLERMGSALATKLTRHVAEKREIPLDLFLRALGIRELAKRTSQILAGFGTLSRVMACTEEELASIHGVGPVIAREVVAGLRANEPLIKRLLKHVRVTSIQHAQKKERGPFSGRHVLFTGTLLAMERKTAQQLVEKEGGIAASGVSKSLDYLVIGDGGGTGSKLAKARELVVTGAELKIIGEKEFLKLLHGGD